MQQLLRLGLPEACRQLPGLPAVKGEVLKVPKLCAVRQPVGGYQPVSPLREPNLPAKSQSTHSLPAVLPGHKAQSPLALAAKQGDSALPPFIKAVGAAVLPELGYLPRGKPLPGPELRLFGSRAPAGVQTLPQLLCPLALLLALKPLLRAEPSGPYTAVLWRHEVIMPCHISPGQAHLHYFSLAGIYKLLSEHTAVTGRHPDAAKAQAHTGISSAVSDPPGYLPQKPLVEHIILNYGSGYAGAAVVRHPDRELPSPSVAFGHTQIGDSLPDVYIQRVLSGEQPFPAAVPAYKALRVAEHGPPRGGDKPSHIQPRLRLAGPQEPPLPAVKGLDPGVVVVAVGPPGGVDLPCGYTHAPHGVHREHGLLAAAPAARLIHRHCRGRADVRGPVGDVLRAPAIPLLPEHSPVLRKPSEELRGVIHGITFWQHAYNMPVVPIYNFRNFCHICHYFSSTFITVSTGSGSTGSGPRSAKTTSG